MPRYSRLTIRLALIYLGIGFTLGALMLANEGLGWDPDLGRLLPAHIALLLFGWTTQLAYGVAYWILPRIDGQRGSTSLALVAVVFLNLGTMVLSLSSPATPGTDLPVVGMASVWTSVACFALHAWLRVRAATSA
jgi:cbb3-type cytochrome oxidase subunit 1